MTEATFGQMPGQMPTDPYGQQQPGYPQPYPSAAPQYGPPPVPPRNAGWAVASLIFFWPVAFAAFNHLHDVFPKWAVGDYAGAQYASDRVKQLGKIALGIGIAMYVLSFLFGMLMFVGTMAVLNDAVDAATTTTTTYRR